MMAQNKNGINCVNRSGVNDKGPAHGRSGVNPEHHPIFIPLSRIKFRLGSWNVGTKRGRSRKVVEVLTRRKIDVCCVQEVRWKGASARMVTGKNTEYKFIWSGSSTGVGGVGVLVIRDWVGKIVEVNRVNNRLMFLKLLIGKRIITIVSAYAPQQKSADIDKDIFYELLISSLSRLSENEVVFLGGDLNRHVRRSSNGYECSWWFRIGD